MAGRGVILEGAKELNRKLKRMDEKVQRKILKKALRRGRTIMHREVRNNARSMVGGKMGEILANNFAKKGYSKRGSNAYVMYIVPKAGVDEFVHITKEGKRQYIPEAIASGHAAPGDAGGIKIVPPVPFVRKAYETKKDDARKEVIDKLQSEIKKEWLK